MNGFDLNIDNYEYKELLTLFKIQEEDNKDYIYFKLDDKITKISAQFPEEIADFFKKSKMIILSIMNLLTNNIINENKEIPKFMSKIKSIEGFHLKSEFELFNDIINYDINTKYSSQLIDSKTAEKESMNTPNYTLNRLNPSLNNKNITNKVYNATINELAPGDLNSVKRVTQLLNLNINSCFRNNYFQSNPCDFLYMIPSEIKNVTAMRLVSIEIPNSWYLISNKKKNNSFQIIVHDKNKKNYCYDIIIPDGNYDSDTLEQYLNTHFFYESGMDNYLQYIKFSINHQNLKSTFEIIDQCNEECKELSFSLKFSESIGQNMMNTLGWILGFRIGNYLNITDQITSEGLFDAGGDRYIYVCINDYQYNSNTSNMVCFDKSILNEDVIAKIPMVNGKLSLIINDNNNTLAKLRRYNGPITLSRLQIKIVDHFGTIIDLNNMDFSLTLELEILYENFNFRNVTA